MSMESHELYKSKCNKANPCHLVMADELHYAKYGCEYGDNSCGYDHDDMVNEIDSFINCTNHKGE